MILQNIKISEAVLSKTNVQGRNEGKAFDDLVASVKEKGVLVPVLARNIGGKWEVIAGNRRLAAAKKAGLEEIPAQIVEMTDIEAREAQIVENLQRADIHPIDEGELYRKLIEESKYEISAVAAKVGKSEVYVRQRLFLTNLGESAAAEYRKGNINDGHAVLIAKLSPSDQMKAMKEAVEDSFGDHVTVKELKVWIQDNIYTELENQPWVGNEEAMKAVGPCNEACGIISSVESLFGPVKEGVCTSLKCWRNKMANFIAWKAKEGNLSKVSNEYGKAGSGVCSRSEYVIVAKRGKDRCKSVQQAIIAEGSELGKVIDICVDPHCQTHRGMKSQYGMTPKEQEARRAERKKEKEKAVKEKEAREKKLSEALAKLKWPMSEKHLDALLELSFEISGSNTARSVAKRHELEVVKEKSEWGSEHYDHIGAIRKSAKSMTKTEKVRLVFELLVDSGYESLRSGISKI